VSMTTRRLPALPLVSVPPDRRGTRGRDWAGPSAAAPRRCCRTWFPSCLPSYGRCVHAPVRVRIGRRRLGDASQCVVNVLSLRRGGGRSRGVLLLLGVRFGRRGVRRGLVAFTFILSTDDSGIFDDPSRQFDCPVASSGPRTSFAPRWLGPACLGIVRRGFGIVDGRRLVMDRVGSRRAGRSRNALRCRRALVVHPYAVLPTK